MSAVRLALRGGKAFVTVVLGRAMIGGFGTEVAERFEDLEGAELEGGVADVGGIEVRGEIGSGLLAGAGLGEPGLFKEPVLVTTFFPLTKVSWFEVVAVLAEALDDVRVREAVPHPEVDLVAKRFGEPSDLAITTVLEGGGRLGQVAERRIRRGRSLGAECLVVGVHTSEKLLEFSRV